MSTRSSRSRRCRWSSRCSPAPVRRARCSSCPTRASPGRHIPRVNAVERDGSTSRAGRHLGGVRQVVAAVGILHDDLPDATSDSRCARNSLSRVANSTLPFFRMQLNVMFSASGESAVCGQVGRCPRTGKSSPSPNPKALLSRCESM